MNHTQDNRVLCCACFPHLKKANSGLCSGDWFEHTAQHWQLCSRLAQQLGKNLSACTYRLFLTDNYCFEDNRKMMPEWAGKCSAGFHNLAWTSWLEPRPRLPWIFSGFGSHSGHSKPQPFSSAWIQTYVPRLGFCLVLKGKGVYLITYLCYWIIIQRAN